MTTHSATEAATTTGSADADLPPTLLSLPAPLLEQVLGLDNLHNCLAATHVNQRLRRVALDSVVGRAADPCTLCGVAERGSTVAVRALLEFGADVNAADPDCGLPAAWTDRWQTNGSVAIVEMVFKEGFAAGSEKAASAQRGMTPLHHAAVHDQADCLRLLLDNGADPGAIFVSSDGQRLSALDFAVTVGNHEVVRLLLAAGVSPHSAAHHDENCPHPLLRAAMDGNLGVLNILLDAGADPELNFTSSSGTPLQSAVIMGHCGVAAALLERGADVNATMEDGRPLLFDVLVENDAEMLRLLLSHGANPESCGEGMSTPLMNAAWMDHLESVQVLLEAGSRMDARSEPHGLTALHMAAQNGNLRVVKALLAAGASCTICDADGRTALDSAVEAGHKAVAAVLRAGGA